MPAARPRRTATHEAAFVLHQYDWSESSLILDLFTRGHGRVAVVAKGAKRPYSQLRTVLLPFQRLAVTLSRQEAPDDTAEVHTLRAAEWVGGRAMPAGDALFAGFHLNELLIKLIARGDPQPLLFDAYDGTLASLAAPLATSAGAASVGGAGAADNALRAFELVLLREIGWLPDLAVVTATQAPVQAGRPYAVRPELGLVPVAEGDDGAAALAVDGAVCGALQAALDAQALDRLQATCALARAPLKAQLRQLLHYHLVTPQLRTRRIVRDLQRLAEAPPPAGAPEKAAP